LGDAFELLNLKDIRFTGEIPETQNTIEGNAAQKAFFIYDKYGFNCFSDDSGLEIEALNGEPGVFSARYAGDGCTFEDNIKKVLQKMHGKLNRKARFRTIIALVQEGNLHTFEGRINGEITLKKRGNEGFGYDPIFQPEGYSQTFAEMSSIYKNNISHRSLALHKLIEYFGKK